MSESRTEILVPGPAEGLAGLLDVDPPDAELPPLWHWAYLLDRRPHRDLGADGHPTRGVPEPPGPGRMRMFAGGRVRTRRPLRLGAPATRTSRIVGSVQKPGRSGALTLVTVRHEYGQHGAIAVVDEQDIVYRAPDGSPPAPGPARLAGDGVRLHADTTLLFRFSALTYNAHRIHYDRDYCRAEGYAGLVVHGPLQAVVMAGALRRAGADFVGREFRYRLVAPLVGEQTLTARQAREPDGWTAEVTGADGRVTATGALPDA